MTPPSEMASAQAFYDDYWARGLYPEGSGLAPVVRRVYEERVRSTSRCIDVGCGNGKASGPLLQRLAAHYVGVDVSATAVGQARLIGLDARVIDDAAALPFEDASFDFAACIEVLEHLVRPDLAAKEIARVLTPGGVVVVTVPNVAYWRRRVDLGVGRWNPGGDDQSVSQPWRDPHLRFFNPTSLQGMLRRAAFDPILVSGHGGALLRDLPVLRRLGDGGTSSLYGRLEARAPGFFAARLHCVAVKPPATGSSPLVSTVHAR